MENDRWLARNIQKSEILTTDVLIIGSGIAGLFASLSLASRCKVTVLTKASLVTGSTEQAQGGIAAALRPEDTPESHFQDTLDAGADLCSAEAARVLTQNGPACVRKLIELGVDFDRSGGELDFLQEAAHSCRRVLHAHGDQTGRVVEHHLASILRAQGSLAIVEDCFVIDILKNQANEAAGAVALQEGRLKVWLAKAVVLATGGLGQLYRYTTNPGVVTGDGIAAAFRAGAEVMNMEFIQFHPTAFIHPDGACFLISESVRGEGARLRNEQGLFFMDAVPGKELAPRDVVARAIWDERSRGRVWLDFAELEGKGEGKAIQERFPQIYEHCRSQGIDLEREPVPVSPAAHYFMGGIRTDTAGRTTIKHLYACGECACNGVHGANRLASNSLLDGLVFGAATAVALAVSVKERQMPTWQDVYWEEQPGQDKPVGGPGSTEETRRMRAELARIMWDNVGIIRQADGLRQALRAIALLSAAYQPWPEREVLELGNMLELGRLVTLFALSRQESRGSHFRSDYPERQDALRRHSIYKKGDQHVQFIGF